MLTSGLGAKQLLALNEDISCNNTVWSCKLSDPPVTGDRNKFAFFINKKETHLYNLQMSMVLHDTDL